MTIHIKTVPVQYLWEIIFGGLTKPNAEQTDEMKTWRTKGNIGMAIIVLSITPIHRKYIKNCPSLNEALIT